jgi:hypothetical protein
MSTTTPNQKSTMDLLQDLTDEQASTVTGGFFTPSLARLAARIQRAASEPTATDINCFVFDIGGDAVIEFQAPAFLTPFLTRSPRISLASSMPQ